MRTARLYVHIIFLRYAYTIGRYLFSVIANLKKTEPFVGTGMRAAKKERKKGVCLSRMNSALESESVPLSENKFGDSKPLQDVYRN